MNVDKLKRIIKMKALVTHYVDKRKLQYGPRFMQKLCGTDGNGKGISFSESEKLALQEGVRKFLKDIDYKP